MTRDAIIGAALAMADRDGLLGVTIRGLAEALDVPPMTLYSGFSSKSELLDLMYLEVAGRLFADVEQPTWQAALRSVGSNMRRLIGEHPNWVPLFSRPLALDSPQRESLLRSLRSAGMRAEQASLALSTMIFSSLGLMLVDVELRTSLAAGSGGDQAGAEPSSDAPDEPRTIAGVQLDQIHEQTIDLLILGFEAHLARDGAVSAV